MSDKTHTDRDGNVLRIGDRVTTAGRAGAGQPLIAGILVNVERDLATIDTGDGHRRRSLRHVRLVSPQPVSRVRAAEPCAGWIVQGPYPGPTATAWRTFRRASDAIVPGSEFASYDEAADYCRRGGHLLPAPDAAPDLTQRTAVCSACAHQRPYSGEPPARCENCGAGTLRYFDHSWDADDYSAAVTGDDPDLAAGDVADLDPDPSDRPEGVLRPGERFNEIGAVVYSSRYLHDHEATDRPRPGREFADRHGIRYRVLGLQTDDTRARCAVIAGAPSCTISLALVSIANCMAPRFTPAVVVADEAGPIATIEPRSQIEALQLEPLAEFLAGSVRCENCGEPIRETPAGSGSFLIWSGIPHDGLLCAYYRDLKAEPA